jgi:hypothetical protein
MRSWIFVAMVIAGILAIATVARAASPDESPWPPLPPPKTEPVPPPPPQKTQAELEQIYLEWLQKVRLIEIRSLRSTDDKDWQQGRQDLLAIDDDMAVGAMVQILYTPNPRYRGLLIEALARLAARDCVVAKAYLQEIAVGDGSEAHRRKAVEALKAAPGLPAADRLLVHLELDQLGVFRDRAATALATLGEKRAIRLLVERLVTEEVRTVMVDEGVMLQTPNISMSVSGAPSFRQVVVQGSGPGGSLAQTVVDLPTVDVSNVGAGSWMPSRQLVPASELVQMQHPLILAALKALTGKDFGYDVEAWRKWMASPEGSKAVPPWKPMTLKAQ